MVAGQAKRGVRHKSIGERRDRRDRQLGEYIQTDMRRRLLPQHPVEREAVHHGNQGERCRIRSLRRPAFDVDRVAADHAWRQNCGDRCALVGGAGNFTAGRAEISRVLNDLWPAGQFTHSDRIPGRRVPAIPELVNRLSLMQHEIAVPAQLAQHRTRLYRPARPGPRTAATGVKRLASSVIWASRLRRMPCPSAHAPNLRGRLENPSGNCQITDASQFQ